MATTDSLLIACACYAFLGYAIGMRTRRRHAKEAAERRFFASPEFLQRIADMTAALIRDYPTVVLAHDRDGPCGVFVSIHDGELEDPPPPAVLVGNNLYLEGVPGEPD